MRALEILDNPNCAAVELRVFHDAGPAEPVSQVRLERPPGASGWYEVTGWTAAGAPSPAAVQKVDDSGDGIAWLVAGGDAGVRLKPAGSPAPWGLGDPDQWGEPFLLLADPQDIRMTHG